MEKTNSFYLNMLLNDKGMIKDPKRKKDISKKSYNHLCTKHIKSSITARKIQQLYLNNACILRISYTVQINKATICKHLSLSRYLKILPKRNKKNVLRDAYIFNQELTGEGNVIDF